MHQPNPSHADHDLLLIARHAAGDLADSDRVRARALLDTCESCAEVDRDLEAIARATRALPNRATAPRDFRLTPEHAAHLRRGSWLRTILAPIAPARSATRPMAAAFTSLGLVGLLVVAILPGLGGGAAMLGPTREQAVTAASAAPAAQGGAPAPIASAGGPGNEFGAKDQNTSSGGPGGGIAGDATDTLAPAPISLAFLGSLALLTVGVVLYLLRFAARRLR